MTLPDQSAAIPPTVKVNVSQLSPSWQSPSAPSRPAGSLRAPPPMPIPVQVTGAVAVGLRVVPVGVDAEVVRKTSVARTIVTRTAAIEIRQTKRGVFGVRRSLPGVE